MHKKLPQKAHTSPERTCKTKGKKAQEKDGHIQKTGEKKMPNGDKNEQRMPSPTSLLLKQRQEINIQEH